MGRKLTIIALSLLLTACQTVGQTPQASRFALCQNAALLLLPHHNIVDLYIEEMAEAVQGQNPSKVIIITPDHFSQGAQQVSPAASSEHGFSMHEKWVKNRFPKAEVQGIMLKQGTPKENLETLTQQLIANEALAQGKALIIFSVDFSHYLPGRIAQVHDLRSKDVIEASDLSAVSTLEIDSPESIEILLKLAESRGEHVEILHQTNPSLDIGIESFENTTHQFGCALPGPPKERQLHTTMQFARPRQWYQGRTEEDRYLYGYDEVQFSEGETDTAILQWKNGETEQHTFDYFNTKALE